MTPRLATFYRIMGGMVMLIVVTIASGSSETPMPDTDVSLIGEIPTLVVDINNNNGYVWLLLHNNGQTEAPLKLTLGNFTSKSTGQTMTTQAIFFKGNETAGTPFIDTRIKPDETLPIKLQVSNLWDSGESTANLTINGATYKLRAVNTNVPFNINLQTPTLDKPQLELARGRDGLMVIKNEDHMNYPLTWQLFIPNMGEIIESTVRIPPQSAVPITVKPPTGWFTRCFEGLFKDEERNAVLTLRYSPDNQANIPGLPVKTIPVTLRLSYWSDSIKSFFGNLILFAVLLLGGMCSLLLGLWIPNRLSRIDLKDRLDKLEGMIRDISSITDSSLRVGIRVERMRLNETLNTIGGFSANAPEQVKLLEKDLEILRQRVELVCQLDDAERKLNTLRARTSGAPPTLLQRAEQMLENATSLLKQTVITETDLQSAKTVISTTVNWLDKIDQKDPDFAKLLAERIKKLRIEYDETHGDIGKRAKCKILRPLLSDLFEVVKKATYKTDSAITPEKYHWIDLAIEKLFVLRHYIIRFEDTVTDTTRHNRIKQCEEPFLALLRLQNSNALVSARSITEQISEDVYTTDILGQLEQQNFRIKREPLTTYINSPVRLWVEFSDKKFDYAAARQAFQCVWKFHASVGEEQGWEILHYFRNEAEAKFKVKFKTGDGQAVSMDGGDVVLHEVPIRIRAKGGISDRAKVETGKLALALGLAALALIAGAREQLLKLDIVMGLVAVFLIGFGADSIKNLFTKRV